MIGMPYVFEKCKREKGDLNEMLTVSFFLIYKLTIKYYQPGH